MFIIEIRSRFNGRRHWPVHVRYRRKKRLLSHLLMSSCYYYSDHKLILIYHSTDGGRLKICR